MKKVKREFRCMECGDKKKSDVKRCEKCNGIVRQRIRSPKFITR